MSDEMARGTAQSHKYPCPDCSFCQQCGDDRCRLCRGDRPAARVKLSLAAQIALYESLNRRETGAPEPGDSAVAASEAP